MKIAIYSDIHGNLEALKKAITEISSHKPDKIACLGDIVGYGANPNECLDIVKEHANYIVVGNHDRAAIGELDTTCFNPYAKEAVKWTEKTLREDNKDFLRNLPPEITTDDFHLVHASPYHPLEFRYIMTEIDLIQAFESSPRPVCFTAHSHVYMTFIRDADDFYTRDTCLTLDADAIVNVGSVGQPRDNVPTGVYAIYNTETQALDIYRFKYDIKTAAKKIKQAGLPNILAERLFEGR